MEDRLYCMGQTDRCLGSSLLITCLIAADRMDKDDKPLSVWYMRSRLVSPKILKIQSWNLSFHKILILLLQNYRFRSPKFNLTTKLAFCHAIISTLCPRKKEGQVVQPLRSYAETPGLLPTRLFPWQPSCASGKRDQTPPPWTSWGSFCPSTSHRAAPKDRWTGSEIPWPQPAPRGHGDLRQSSLISPMRRIPRRPCPPVSQPLWVIWIVDMMASIQCRSAM